MSDGHPAGPPVQGPALVSSWIERHLSRAGARPALPHAWVLRRLVLAAATLAIASVVIFAATQALPGDAAQAALGRDASEARLASVREALGLDRPVHAQYGAWLGRLVQGDLGASLATGGPVASALSSPLRNTAMLVFITALIAIPLAIAVALVAARRPHGRLDRAIDLLCLVCVGLPEFVVGVALLALFATTVWSVLPAVSLIPPGDTPLDRLDTMVLPVVTLVIVCVPYLTRLMRAGLIDSLASGYVEAARLNGVHERRVLSRHVLPNALIPLIQGSALTIAYLAGGIVVVEYLFAYPGLGTALSDAISTRDIPMIQATVLILALFYIAVNLLADVLTVLATPRLRTGDA